VKKACPKKIVEANRSRSGEEFKDWLVTHGGQLLLPMVEALCAGKRKLDEVLKETSSSLIEALLKVSAEQVAGARHQGRRGGEVQRYGEQGGLIPLSDRKLRVKKPRLRRRGVGTGGEVPLPVYEAFWEHPGLAERVLDVMIRGVSTREYENVLPQMADAVGMKKSSVSREFIEASVALLEQLNQRRFDQVDLLVIYVDGIEFAQHCVLGAVGVDNQGRKHVLGLREGASENATVVTALLEDLVERGVKPDREYLFVIDGSKALRKGIDQVFGHQQPVQRCHNHKVRNVLGYLPDDLKAQTQKTMKAAFKLPLKAGMAKLEQYARWLQVEHPSAAQSLREGLPEMFTADRLGLTESLKRCLCVTNIVDSSHAGVRQKTRRVTRWQDGSMVMRWAAASFLQTEKHYRKLMGHKDLWMLEVALHRRKEVVHPDKLAA